MAAASARVQVEPVRPRAQDMDRYIGNRIRERRIMLGLAQQQLAELIGVTYQQAHKYEKGITRIASGRLFTIAQALGVEVGYFYEGQSEERAPLRPTAQQRLLLELTRNFINMPNRRHQEELCNLARTLADLELAPSDDSDDLPPSHAG